MWCCSSESILKHRLSFCCAVAVRHCHIVANIIMYFFIMAAKVLKIKEKAKGKGCLILKIP
jgi:hypothetical protein